MIRATHILPRGDWLETRVDIQKQGSRLAFGNFRDAFGFATRVALVAEAEGHHPDMEVGWGRVVLAFTTHAAGGLTPNDFVMAAKTDRL